MILATILSAIFAGILYLIYELWKINQTFKERNVKHTKPTLFFGHTFKSTLRLKHPMDDVFDACMAFPDEEIIGFFQIVKPVFIVKSADLVEKILIKDFGHFYDRMTIEQKIESPADANLFFMQGNTWRALRQKLTPLFTTVKLKLMFNSIADCWKTFRTLIDGKEGKDVEMSDIFSMFAVDVIGSAAFGIEPHSMQNPDSMFRRNGMKIIDNSILQNIKTLIFVFFPKVAKFLNIRGIFDVKLVNYFCDILKSTFEQRKKENIIRNDFAQMLLQMREKGKIEVQIHDSDDNYLMMAKTNETFEFEITDNVLLGTAFTFLTAGFHATAMTLSFAMYELAQHHDVVEKLRMEIKSVVKGEEPTYDELKSMSYCEYIIKETLRLYPIVPSISRTCTKEYTAPNGLVLAKGDSIFIPASVIHRDPAYWEDPDTFNPDRFQDTPKPGSYLPFGDGPRICIAMRFALLEMKFSLAQLIRNYDIKLSEKTKIPLKMNPRIFFYTPLDGIYLQIKKIKI